MSEVSSTQPSPKPTAGALLRQARQARGLHLMALSASLKVAPGRLEAMEEDRWHDLPDAAYARALAHTVSRALGIDPQPVLSSLPAASQPRLETLDEGLDEPFRETPSAFGGFLPGLLAAFMRTHPAVVLDLEDAISEDAVRAGIRAAIVRR